MNNHKERENGVDYLVVEIDASKCITKASLYEEFSANFQFPYSKYAPSTDVLLDFARDLGWFQNRNFRLRIVNLKKAMKQNPQKLEEFRELCKSIQEYWESHHLRMKDPFQNNFKVDWNDA